MKTKLLARQAAAPNWWPLFHSAPSCPGPLLKKSWTRLAQPLTGQSHQRSLASHGVTPPRP